LRDKSCKNKERKNSGKYKEFDISLRRAA